MFVFVIGLSMNFIKAKEKQHEPRKLNQFESVEISTYLARLYKTNLISVTDSFLSDFRDSKNGELLDEIFQNVANERLNYTDVGNWEKAKLLYVGDNPADYAVNSDNKVANIYEEEIASKIKDGNFVCATGNKDFHLVGVTLFSDIRELGKTKDGIERKNGCIECHKIIKGNNRIRDEHLKGAIVFKIPRNDD